MPSQFEMDPSPYHLGTCNVVVVDPASGASHPCGLPAVERVLGMGAEEVGGDRRLCAEHRYNEPP